MLNRHSPVNSGKEFDSFVGCAVDEAIRTTVVNVGRMRVYVPEARVMKMTASHEGFGSDITGQAMHEIREDTEKKHSSLHANN